MNTLFTDQYLHFETTKLNYNQKVEKNTDKSFTKANTTIVF